MSSLYFNNAFSKQPLPEAMEAMQPFLRDRFENPLTESSGAEEAREAIEVARKQVARLIKANPHEIYFVSSGTEANNWAVKGTAWRKHRKHIVISAIEHFSVYKTAQFLERQGLEVTIVPVNPQGLIDVEQLAGAVRPTTVLVATESASDEIGVIQDLHAISNVKRKFDDVLFHTDAVSFVCYEDLDVSQTPYDLVTLSSNALYGPPGIAALYVREGSRLQPLLHGGMQESGMRPGLQSVALIAGFGKAAEINLQRKNEWKNKLSKLQQIMFNFFDSQRVSVTGSRRFRIVDNLHVVADVDGEAMLTLLLEHGIQASSGSTCYQYAQKESHVLSALGIQKEQARGALLFTLGVGQTSADVQRMSDAFEQALSHLRKLKP
jgi:cysteine desulfurase